MRDIAVALLSRVCHTAVVATKLETADPRRRTAEIRQINDAVTDTVSHYYNGTETWMRGVTLQRCRGVEMLLSSVTDCSCDRSLNL